MRKSFRIGLTVLLAMATTLVIASPASASHRYYYGPHGCWGQIWDTIDIYGYDIGDNYDAICPTSAPGTEWRADVTWHTPSYQYYVAGLEWRTQGSWNSGGMGKNTGFLDAIQNWQVR